MESVENQASGGLNPTAGQIENRAREIGRKVDTASAKLHNTWDGAASQVKTRIGDTGKNVKNKLAGAGTQAKEKLAAAKVATTNKAQGYKLNVEQQVHAHPFRAIGYAFGAGALLGLLLRRRR
ncbi:MAG: DUF883 family protein [Candidatus Latescibacterota bacterium]|nr:MAG: DUF883 family protein [Candidatus Latescibacterota bacterium]